MTDRAQGLRECDTLLLHLVESAVDGIITIDEDGAIQSFNPAAERTFGYTAQELIGKNVSVLMPLPVKAEHDGYLASYRKTKRKKIIGASREVVGRRKDGTTFPMEINVTEVQLSDRLLYAAFVRDVAWRKQIENLRGELFRRVMSAQEEERRRMALDLHDGIGQGLTSLLVGLQGLRVLPSLESVRERTEELHRHAAITLDEVRRLARGMRPLVLDELGLAAALERDAAEFAETHEVVVDLHAPGLPRLPSEVETTVYRIVQESLTNVAKHAAASTVSIVIHRKDEFLEAIIEDDGRGFDSEAVLRSEELGKHLGLSSLAERAALLNGNVTIESVPGSGTTIRVRIPLPGGTNMTKIRVLVADDHAVLRSGLRLLMNAQPDMEVVGEAGDGNEVLRKVAELVPDVLSLDLSMPGPSGIKLIERLRDKMPRMRILVLTMHDDAAFLRAVLAAGGAGYVVKRSPDQELLAGIRAVHQGRIYVNVSVENTVGGCQVLVGGPTELLSARELEVLHWLVQGETNKEIAARLFLSGKTVTTYRARILEKLGLRSRAELVRYAFATGLLAAERVSPLDPAS